MVDLQLIQSKIYEIRGQRVMLDFDLAQMYGTETKVLKQAVKRNIKRFPTDFMFELNKEEFSHLDVLSFHKQSRVINMVVKGDINEIKDYLRMFNPIMLEVLPVNLEEIFIYELGGADYAVRDILF